MSFSRLKSEDIMDLRFATILLLIGCGIAMASMPCPSRVRRDMQKEGRKPIRVPRQHAHAYYCPLQRQSDFLSDFLNVFVDSEVYSLPMRVLMFCNLAMCTFCLLLCIMDCLELDRDRNPVQNDPTPFHLIDTVYLTRDRFRVGAIILFNRNVASAFLTRIPIDPP